MIKGKQKTELLTADEVLMRTGGGYDIYRYYLGNVGRVMPRPWGKDNHPSWGIFPYNGIWMWKDQAKEDSGTAIQFVEKYFGLSFGEAMAKICWDFGINNGREINAKPVKINWERPEEVEKDYCSIKFDDKPFEKRHHEFWNIAEASEEHCRKYDCYAVKSLAIDGKRVGIRKDEIVFAFYVPELDSAKIYFADRKKENKFKNNVPYRHLWHFDKIQQCDDLIVQKSPKDLIITALITPCVTATQNESIKVFNEDIVGKINSVTKTPWIWYGSDDDGVKKCKTVTGANKWKYINTPKALLPDVNDTYSFVRFHNEQSMGTGLQNLTEFMKHKKLLK